LQALEPGWVTARQIEAARRVIVREMKRRGKVWIRIFPAKPYTHKPPETRMGSGKGNVEYYVAVVKPGRIMFEISGLPEDVALFALKSAQYKFSIRTKVVSRHDAGESV
jgi:large subunit ribosomal protein L16